VNIKQTETQTQTKTETQIRTHLPSFHPKACSKAPEKKILLGSKQNTHWSKINTVLFTSLTTNRKQIINYDNH
jgi:hypothetical protein